MSASYDDLADRKYKKKKLLSLTGSRVSCNSTNSNENKLQKFQKWFLFIIANEQYINMNSREIIHSKENNHISFHIVFRSYSWQAKEERARDWKHKSWPFDLNTFQYTGNSTQDFHPFYIDFQTHNNKEQEMQNGQLTHTARNEWLEELPLLKHTIRNEGRLQQKLEGPLEK